LLRSAEAAGAGAVLFCDGSVDPYGPKCVRSSAGSLFRLAVTRDAASGAALAALATAGCPTVASLARGAPPYDAVDLTGPVALVLGNEAHGLPAEIAADLDLVVRVPLTGRAESLNLAAAAAVLLYETARRQARDRTREEADGGR
ncbi:MAG: TrmH family RNA methyltransferase, partial [Actinomycetota bacterium]